MDKFTLDTLRVRFNSFRTKYSRHKGEPFELTSHEYLGFIKANGIADTILAYGGNSGFSRIDADKPWRLDNLQFVAPPQQEFAGLAAIKARRLAQTPTEIMTKAEWLAELRAVQTSQSHK